jgi:hypothetical protein
MQAGTPPRWVGGRGRFEVDDGGPEADLTPQHEIDVGRRTAQCVGEIGTVE